MKTQEQLRRDAAHQKELDKQAVKALRDLAGRINRGEVKVDSISHSRTWDRKGDAFVDLNEWKLAAEYHVVYPKRH